TIYVNLDPDGLKTVAFKPQKEVTKTNVNNYGLLLPAQKWRPVDAEPNLAWDGSNGPNKGEVYLAYTNSPEVGSSDTDIYVQTSTNDGATWSNAIRVNDPNANSQFLPAIAADQTTGTVAITWYDARNDPNNAKAQIYGTVTVDGGKNYVPDVKIGAQLSDTAAAVKVNQETAKASEDSTPTTLKDATKNWEVDQWAG